MNTVQAPERVRDLARTIADETHRRFGSRARVIWFGSWVRGTARPNSDLDLAIDVPGGLSMQDYAGLWTWTDDLPTLYRVDLVKLDEVGDELRREILTQGKEI